MKPFVAKLGRGLENILRPPKIYRDDYTWWVMFANAGMLEHSSLHCFDVALSKLRSNNPIIEIGSFAGLSTNLISYFRSRNRRTNPLFSCDEWLFEGRGNGFLGETQITHDDYREFVKESFIRNVRRFGVGDLPHHVEVSSDAFFDLWRDGAEGVDLFGRNFRMGGPISFAFIDGDHRFEPAMRDFLNVDEFLEPGGFIYFDDSARFANFEVYDVIRRVKKLKRYEVVMRNPHYLFQRSA